MIQPLAEAIFWIAAIACVVAEAAILRGAFDDAGANKSPTVPVGRRGTEMVWALLPALALSLVLIATWRRIEARDPHAHMDHSRMLPSMSMPAARH